MTFMSPWKVGEKLCKKIKPCGFLETLERLRSITWARHAVNEFGGLVKIGILPSVLASV